MKKLMSALLFILMVNNLFAQKSAIQSAIQSLKDNDFDKAKTQIDAACTNAATSENAKAWLIKAVLYQAIGTNKEDMPQMTFVINDNPFLINLTAAEALHTANPTALLTAIDAYKKAISLDPKYTKEELQPLLQMLALVAYNNGAKQMSDNKHQDAAKSFELAYDAITLDNGKVMKGIAQIDTLSATAQYYQGYCYYMMNDYEKATTLLDQVARGAMVNTSDVYLMLTEIYEKQKNDAKWSEAMKMGRTKFPNDKKLLNSEINYYINNNRAEESVAKLKEGIAADPGNLDRYILLGQTYYNMAYPVNGSRPANAEELEKNALEQYSKVIAKDPNNLYGQCFTGILYFNQAKEINDVMIKADDKKYTELKPKRDELINKSITYLEKTVSLTEAVGVKDENRENYKTALMGLSQAYNLLAKTDKADGIKKKLDSLK